MFKIEVIDSKLIDRIRNQVNDSSHSKLVSLLTEIANRVLINIRNFGTVAHIQAINTSKNKPEYYLYRWDVKIAYRHVFKPILKKPNLLEMLSCMEEPNIPEVNTSSWPSIEEAIQDNLSTPPEKEFMVNAIESLRNNNLRMALLEAVIGLEIVLSDYLYLFLNKKRGLPKSKIKQFITPQLGLTARLYGLLDLTLGKELLAEINIDIIHNAVQWRNSITHKTGKLPEQLKNADVKNGVIELLKLLIVLAGERDKIRSEPALKEIAQLVAEENKIPEPNIRAINHHVSADIHFIFSDIPNKNVLAKVSQNLAEHLRKRDARFDSSKHLFIRFLSFPSKAVAYWKKDSIEMVDS